MRLETRAELGKQGVEIASVRGCLQALAEPTAWASKQYLQQRIAVMEERLADVQHKLNEIEWGEKVEWSEK